MMCRCGKEMFFAAKYNMWVCVDKCGGVRVNTK
jgi:hypothetical protein